MKRKGPNSHVVLLSCSHTQIWLQDDLPYPGYQCRCGRCGGIRFVVDSVAEYRVKCNTCRFSRGYGAALLSAQIAADRHHNRFTNHTLVLLQGNSIIERRFPNAGQKKIFDVTLDEPPF